MPLFGKPSRRKNYIINRPFQGSFILHTCGLATAVLGVTYGANAWFFYNLTQKAIDKGIPKSHIFFRFVEQQETQMNIIFAVTGVMIFAGICAFGLFYSHRIAGPLYRLTQHLRGLTEGRAIVDVRFRKGDYFPEIADAFNAFLRSRFPPAPEKASPGPADQAGVTGKAPDAKVS